MTYRDRREARADRLDEWAAKREQKAADLHALNEPYRGDVAFCTQPGHIPERARAIARTERAWGHEAKAADMASRAAGIRSQLDRSIYSDDPDAVAALEARIAELEEQRDRIKAENAAFRKAHGPELRAMSAYERDQVMPHPSYRLTNLSGNIKRNRDRLEVIRAQQARTVAAEESGGVTVEGDAYVRVTFAEKPDRETLSALKAAGFRWSGGSWLGYRAQLPSGIGDDHGPGCDGPDNCVCSTEPAGLIGCEVEGCAARFFLVESRQFPRLCLEHSDEASREVDGWTPANSRD